MKILLKVVGVIVACVIVALVVLSIIGSRSQAAQAWAVAQRGRAELPRGLDVCG